MKVLTSSPSISLIRWVAVSLHRKHFAGAFLEESDHIVAKREAAKPIPIVNKKKFGMKKNRFVVFFGTHALNKK